MISPFAKEVLSALAFDWIARDSLIAATTRSADALSSCVRFWRAAASSASAALRSRLIAADARMLATPAVGVSSTSEALMVSLSR
ncbi:hypothetical protein BRD12_05255 [Halobacteriales archaeon SW_12_67_38]|nr:MAG: hypothetical protein BRD12_05255 [Halobacteriales archaeon SW_12_67_38]